MLLCCCETNYVRWFAPRWYNKILYLFVVSWFHASYRLICILSLAHYCLTFASCVEWLWFRFSAYLFLLFLLFSFSCVICANLGVKLFIQKCGWEDEEKFEKWLKNLYFCLHRKRLTSNLFTQRVLLRSCCID